MYFKSDNYFHMYLGEMDPIMTIISNGVGNGFKKDHYFQIIWRWIQKKDYYFQVIWKWTQNGSLFPNYLKIDKKWTMVIFPIFRN